MTSGIIQGLYVELRTGKVYDAIELPFFLGVSLVSNEVPYSVAYYVGYKAFKERYCRLEDYESFKQKKALDEEAEKLFK